MVGRVAPGYGIDDNPSTTGRSLGYGADTVTWVQQMPSSLRLEPVGSPAGGGVSRAAPGFSSAHSRTLDYGCGCSAPKYYGVTYPLAVLNKKIGLGGISIAIGTAIIIAVIGVIVYKKRNKVESTIKKLMP